MKIGIYDKWLDTLGGGEKVATVMAECLSKKGHRVDLISNSDVEKDEVEEKMEADLSRVKFVSWFERAYDKLSPRTKKYDIFINVSFLDHLPSLAKRSLYYVHFPTPTERTILSFIKYEKLLPFLRSYLIIPRISSGLRHIDEIYARGGKWLSPENTIVITNPPKRFRAKFRVFAEQLSISSLNSVEFDSPNAKIRLEDKYIDHSNNVLAYRLKVELTREESLILKIKVKENLTGNALGLVSMTIMDWRYLLWNAIKRYLPKYEMALYGSSAYKPAAGLDTYDLFLTNSQYTKKWTKKYWDKESKVLYPPVDLAKFRPGKKRNIILNVGRFFVDGHSKRQDILVEAFKEMINKKELKEGWELHLVGGVGQGKKHEEYLNKIKIKAKDYPILFHLFASFERLKTLYSQAKIYWHATGFGETPQKNPINFEHFGISTVEAMVAGVVPLVFNGGGQPEIVKHGKNGFLWNDLEELTELTIKLIRDKKLLEGLSRMAKIASQKYAKERFVSRFIKLLKEIQT